MILGYKLLIRGDGQAWDFLSDVSSFRSQTERDILYSLWNAGTWKPEQWIEATCANQFHTTYSNEQVPHTGMAHWTHPSCGIHGATAKEPLELLRKETDWSDMEQIFCEQYRHGPYVCTLAEAAGNVVIHKQGWRAQYCRILGTVEEQVPGYLCFSQEEADDAVAWSVEWMRKEGYFDATGQGDQEGICPQTGSRVYTRPWMAFHLSSYSPKSWYGTFDPTPEAR